MKALGKVIRVNGHFVADHDDVVLAHSARHGAAQRKRKGQACWPGLTWYPGVANACRDSRANAVVQQARGLQSTIMHDRVPHHTARDWRRSLASTRPVARGPLEGAQRLGARPDRPWGRPERTFLQLLTVSASSSSRCLPPNAAAALAMKAPMMSDSAPINAKVAPAFRAVSAASCAVTLACSIWASTASTRAVASASDSPVRARPARQPPHRLPLYKAFRGKHDGCIKLVMRP